MRCLYTLFVWFYLQGIRLASVFNAKARCWLRGRKRWRERMRGKAMAGAGNGVPGTIWFHCASLGEFEQGRPVIEKFREEYPRWRILLTFFSPSGYEHRKTYPHADHVEYMPVDTPGNVRAFLDIWNPRLVVFVKYEYWFNYLHALARRRIPVVVVSAIFRREHHFFRWYGGWLRKQLSHITCFFVQDVQSLERLGAHGFHNVVVSGDTRFDRVYALRRQKRSFPLTEKFATGHNLLVAGSTWPKDEALLYHLIGTMPNMRYIIAPHEVHEENLRRLERDLGNVAARYSSVHPEMSSGKTVLIIDSIGLLSQLYQYAAIAYIGGGFSASGIHNILEAATFGVPVLFGPNHTKFAEANELLRAGGAWSVCNQQELLTAVQRLLGDPGKRERMGAVCSRYVEQKKGAAATIMAHLRKLTGDNQ